MANSAARPDPARVGDQRETARLGALRDLAILDTLPDERFDRLTQLAATLFDTPMALVSLIDEDRQWFKSRLGLKAAETPRDWAFCDHAIRGKPNTTFVIPDAASDPRFSANPMVTGDPGVRFYAGATLTTPDGHNVGTLCVIDPKPRPVPSNADLERLSVLAQMVVDELELAKITAKVAKQNRLLQLAEAMSGVGHWRYDIASGKVDWSDEVYRIHGVNPRDFDPNLGEGVGFYHVDDQPLVVRYVERAMQFGEDFTFQLRLVRPDGVLRHVVSKGACEVNAQGRRIAVIGVFQDVTEQVERVQAIAETEARYRLLAENANDMVTEMNREGMFTYVSPSVFAMTGYRSDEVLGRRALHFILPEDHARVSDAFAKASIQNPGWTIEYRVRRKDGAVIWVEARPSLTRNSDNVVTGVTDVIRDVTARKVMEADLERARAEAEAAAVVKGEFLANMSHELRTPLTSIVGFADLMKSVGGLDEDGLRYVERIADSSQALLNVVNDILDFSRLEAGQVAITPHPVDPVGLIAGALDLLAPQAAAKGLILTADLDGLPSLLMLDAARVRQILLNLIGNAVKFTAAGSVTVEGRYDVQEQRLRCTVTDTGPGVSVDRVDSLFQRFSQIDGSTTRSHGGTGLGLAICKGLAEAMGGAVGADSTSGAGSRFWFEITCTPALAPTLMAAQVAERSTRLDGLRLLVADDNPINRELVRLILTPVGVEVITAASGEDALHEAAYKPFDVILMDVRMPGIDGPAAARAIRDRPGPNRHTRLIAFTADVLDNVASSPLFDAYIPKPIIANDLIEVVASSWRENL